MATLRHLSLILVVCLTFVLASNPTPFLQVAPSYRITWNVNETSQIVTVNVQVNAACWVGLAWHCADSSCSSQKGMTNADYAIAIFDENGTLIEVQDGVSSPNKNGFTRPLNDIAVNGTNDFFDVSGYQTKQPAFTTFTFSRKLVTADINDHPFNNTVTRFVWAHGDLENTEHSPNEFRFHGQKYRGGFEANLFLAPDLQQPSQPVVSDISQLIIQWHGSLMTFGFSICMTIGMFVARHLKSHKWWFSVHILLQVLGTVAALTAFGLVLWLKIDNNYPQFASTHSRFGLATLIVVVLNVFKGWLAHVKWNPKRTSPPVFPDQIHWWLGRAIFVLSTVTVILGQLTYEVGLPVILVYSIAIGTAVFFYFYIDIYKRVSGDSEDHKDYTETQKLLGVNNF
jgi:hypothetical protein